MNKKAPAKNITTKANKQDQALNQKAMKNMPAEPLPQPKDYDEIEY